MENRLKTKNGKPNTTEFVFSRGGGKGNRTMYLPMVCHMIIANTYIRIHIHRYGHINLQKGGTFEEYPTDLESVTITTGPNAGQSFELSWYCVPPEPKEQKVKVVENTKKETTKKTQVISSQSQSNKLYSTYKGTLNQKYNRRKLKNI